MRLILLTSLLIGLFFGAAPDVWALDIPVRAGSHKDYSRLVFDWPQATTYTAKRAEEGALHLTFDAAANLDETSLSKNPVRNIIGLSILSTAPLTVSINIPPKSRIRDFTVANKIIIDVYAPQGESPLPANSLKITSPTPEPEKKEEPKEEQEKEQTTQHKPASTEPLTKEKHPPKPHYGPQEATIKAKSAPTLFTMSSTRGFTLAAFENEGRIWVVTDRDDPLIAPQISGSQTEIIKPLHPLSLNTDTQNGKAYIGTMPQNTRLKGQGGAILWRLMFAPDLTLKDPIFPVRSGVRAKKTRGGKIFWPLKTAKKMMKMQDDFTGESLIVITVENSIDFSGAPQDFIDFCTLRSPIGLAIIPKVDDLTVKIVRGGVEISRPHGLSLSEERRAKRARESMKENSHAASAQNTGHGQGADGSTKQTLFDFNGWRMGGLRALPENRNIILGGLKDLAPAARAENLIILGKAYLSNMMGPEALGVLRFAEQELPDIKETARFKALTGVAKALSGQSEEAFKDFSDDGLQPFPEASLWRAYALSDLGDWQQARGLLPEEAIGIILSYPIMMSHRLALSTAEIYLRSGAIEKAAQLLEDVDRKSKYLPVPVKSKLTYLKGEKARQQNNLEDTQMYWKELINGEDPLYRAKASLALTRLFMEQKKVTRRRAIDKLEQIRYAWRGDDIEAQINYWLGRIYFQDGQHVKGLNIMRDATTYAKNPALAERIANDMGNTFVTLFTDENIGKVSALDAVTLYEQFSELVPPNAQGDKVVEALAGHLVKADLLNRAGDLLSHQVYHRLDGYEAYRVATRLASIRLIDERTDEAMAAINLADMKLKGLPEELQTEKNWRKIALLRARILSAQGRPDQAIAMLNEMDVMPATNRLRADIAWRASYWDDAGEALNDVILDQNISLTRPLSKENTDLLLQRAVALNLASDRVALANMREKFSQSMKQTDKSKIFEIISRPRQSITLSDRETLLSIVSEVDLFSGILDELKNGKE